MNTDEKRTVEKMIRIYCNNKHKPIVDLCDDCGKLYEYAYERLSRCTYGEDKPTCEKCPIHCYKPTMKKQIQDIMRYSGPRMIFYHPITAIKHLFKGFKSKQTMLFLTLGLLMFTSCFRVDAKIWNENIIENYNKIYNNLDDFQELIALGTVGDSAVNAHINTKALEIRSEIDITILQLTEKRIPTDGEKLQISTLTMLEEIKQQVNLAIAFTEYTESTPDNIIERFAQQYDSIANITSSKVDTFILAQKEFAVLKELQE